MSKTQHYKILNALGRACHGGSYVYDLPVQRHDGTWIPGAWTDPIDDIAACQRGYHTTTQRNILSWLGERIWRCEVRTTRDAGDKFVSRQIRLTSGTCWDDTTARLFAVQCALDVLPLYEQRHPDDTRVSDCLVTAWEFAHGLVGDIERAAAWAAAWAAAGAAWAAWSAGAAGAAWAAGAAEAAAGSAGAAGAAGAAWAATGAAGDAAGAAAGAARDAAGDAQSKRLIRYLDGNIPLFPEWLTGRTTR